MAAAAAAAAAAATAATAATLRAALILFCFLQIAMPSRKTSFKSFIHRMSSLLCRGIINLPFQGAISNVIVVDILFALTRICDELFQLRLQFLNQFFFFPCMVRVIYCATTIKSCVGWLGDIGPMHRRRIIAAAVGVGCQK